MKLLETKRNKTHFPIQNIKYHDSTGV